MDELTTLEKIFRNEMDVVDYQYYHQLFHNRTIIFNSEIDETIVESVFLPLRDFEKDNSDEPITLILSSPGGSVTDGLFLADYLTHYSKPLNILVTGYAASLAAVILAAGGKNEKIHRSCYPSTYGLIHDGFIGLTTSESKTASDIMAFNESVDKQIRQFMLDNTNITPEVYDSKTRHQWFLTADEMLKYNLIDEIL